MSKSNIAYTEPYFSETESRWVGDMCFDGRAVWQSNYGPPFYFGDDGELIKAIDFKYRFRPHPTYRQVSNDSANTKKVE